MNNKKRSLTFVGPASFAMVSLCLAGCHKNAPAPTVVPPVEVGIVTLQPQSIHFSTELPGRTSAFRIAEIRPQVGGILQKRLFKEGSEVKGNQSLYQIDPAPFRVNLSRAEANAESAQSLFDRYEKLIKTRAVSQQQYDDARSQYLQAKAAADSARIDLSYTNLNAPIAGRIGRSSVTEGALVIANQSSPLATIQQLDPIYVDITQSATALMRLKAQLASGQLKTDGKDQAEVQLKLEDGKTYTHSGRLQFSEVSVDEGTGAVTLRAVFPNPEGQLLPGMFVRAQLQEGVRDNALLIPQRGVARDTQGNPTALVLDSQNTVQLRQVVTDRSLDGKWLIERGLNPGDRVVVDGIQNVRPGVRVKPVSVMVVGSVSDAAATRGAATTVAKQ